LRGHRTAGRLENLLDPVAGGRALNEDIRSSFAVTITELMIWAYDFITDDYCLTFLNCVYLSLTAP
jgi:hypothetical protein